jgi:energy-converting hydrogenase A subunit M
MQIEIDDKDIDVKNIMRQIKENIAKRNIQEDITSKLSSDLMSSMEEHAFVLSRMWNFSGNFHISSQRKILGPFIVFGKKTIRKMLRWYIDPIVTNQVELNKELMQSFNTLSKYISELEEKIKKMQENNPRSKG